MTFQIEKDEGTQARRRVPFKVFTSDGTSPETGFSDATVLHTVNGGTQVVSNNSASAVSAAAGMYYIEFDTAEITTLGNYAVFTDAVGADFEQHVANFQVVNNNPMSTLSALEKTGYSISGTITTLDGLNDIDGSEVTLHAGTHSSATVQGLSNYANISDVTLHEGTHTAAVVPTVTDVTNQVTADMTAISGDATAADNLEAAFDGDGYDSALTVFVKDSIATIAGVTNTATLIGALNDIDGSEVTLHAGVHSGATIQGIDNDSVMTIAGTTNTATLINALNDIDGSEVTLHAGTHSDVTIKGIENYSIMTIAGVVNTATLIGALNDIDGSEVTLHAGTHSGATIQGIDNDSVMTIAGTTNTATLINALNDIDGSAVTVHESSLSQVADAFLNRSIAGSAQTDKRSVQNALRAIRNRVQVDSSVLTVYQEDDTTSAWTASTTTSADPSGIVHINPL